MDGFFQARSVAVVGVSNTPGNLGRGMVFNLLEFQYRGHIYLVGAKGGAFLSHKIYPSIEDLPETVDLATILVPAGAVPEVLRQCGEKGIRRVVVQSAGFSEFGEDRRRLEDEMRSILERYRMRMIGPNCIGVMNRHTGLSVPFMPMKAEAPPGRVAIVSQSGGVGGMMFNAFGMEHIGFSKFASIGNKLDVNEVDLLEYLSEDSSTSVVFCYLEGIADGRRLMETAFKSPRPIVVHKSNRGGKGKLIARSHSASLAVDDKVVEAAFRQCGIIRVFEQKEAVEVIKAFLHPRMKGRRLGIISRSGGHAVAAADAAEEFGFQLPPYPEELTRLVREHARAGVIQAHNPLDLGDILDLDVYKTLAAKVLSLDDIDGLLFIHIYQGVFDAAESRRLIKGLEEVMGATEKPVAVCVFSTESELIHNRRAVNFPIYTDPREAVRALARNRDWGQVQALPFSHNRPSGMAMAMVRSLLEKLPPGPVPPSELARILSAYSIPLAPSEHALSADEAVEAAYRLGFPVVLKTAQPDVIHKSDVGGVCLDLKDEPSVRQACGKLQRLGPSLLVQKMAESGLEWFVGGRQDPDFGPVVISGPGGIYIEILNETGIRVAPLATEEAARLLQETRASKLLEGVRGQKPLDRPALLDILVRISWLLYDFPQIRELDINPIRIYSDGCLALDWRASKGSSN